MTLKSRQSPAYMIPYLEEYLHVLTKYIKHLNASMLNKKLNYLKLDEIWIRKYLIKKTQ